MKVMYVVLHVGVFFFENYFCYIYKNIMNKCLLKRDTDTKLSFTFLLLAKLCPQFSKTNLGSLVYPSFPHLPSL